MGESAQQMRKSIENPTIFLGHNRPTISHISCDSFHKKKL